MGLGLCIEAAPEIFAFDNKSYKTSVLKQPSSREEEISAQRAVDVCPYRAIYNHGELQWTTRQPKGSIENGWVLQVFIPEAVCEGRDWSPETGVLLLALARNNAPMPPFDEILGAGAHRYLNLRKLARQAPIQKIIPQLRAFVTSNDLYVKGLISQGPSGEIEWSDVDWRFPEVSDNMDSCSMLMLSSDLAIAPFFVRPSRSWYKQFDQGNYYLITNEDEVPWRPATAKFGVNLGGLILAESELTVRFSGMGQGPVNQHDLRLAQRLFASYAQPDLHMVELSASILEAFGIGRLVWDQKVCSPGESRLDTIEQAIMASEAFHLFWSKNAKHSQTVRDEWKFALSLSREGFIRPVYWATPYPVPPRELRHLFFCRIDYDQVTPPITVSQANIVFNSGSLADIRRIEHVEKQYNVNASGIGNVINIAEYMIGVTNTVSQNVKQSDASDEVKNLLTDLVARLSTIAPRLDPVVAEQMGSDAKALSEEIKRSPPRKAWYKLALDGLEETAKRVGEIGAPILEIITKLAPLLGC